MKRLDEEMVRDPRRFGSRPRRDPRRTGPRPRRDRDVGNFGRDETETRHWYVSRRRDRDHIPGKGRTRITPQVLCFLL